MQPHALVSYKQKALQRLKRKLAATRLCDRERGKDPAFALPVPFEAGLKLTNRCDLRCTHCFQWNDEGYHYHLNEKELAKSGDLDIRIVKDVLAFTHAEKAMLYLWGGEPLIYAYWDELVKLLAEDPRETVICTNGLTLPKRLDDLCRISENLTLLVSIEGLEEQHNKLRGKNSFKRTLQGLEALLQKRESGEYQGFVSVAGVLSEELIDHLYDFCAFFEEKKIDTLYINFPWFIPDDVAFEMDEIFKEKYFWMGTDRSFRNTWHSFGFHIPPEKIPQLEAQLQKIEAREWNIRIRFQPDLDHGDMIGFIHGDTKPGQQKTRCLGISNRLDILPDGKVTPCKKFTEFIVGNAAEQPLSEIWKGSDFRRFRETHNNTLMPICSKCEILYMNGI